MLHVFVSISTLGHHHPAERMASGGRSAIDALLVCQRRQEPSVSRRMRIRIPSLSFLNVRAFALQSVTVTTAHGLTGVCKAASLSAISVNGAKNASTSLSNLDQSPRSAYCSRAPPVHDAGVLNDCAALPPLMSVPSTSVRPSRSGVTSNIATYFLGLCAPPLSPTTSVAGGYDKTPCFRCTGHEV